METEARIYNGWQDPVSEPPLRRGPDGRPRRIVALPVIWLIAATILSVEILVDHVPRFFQGDSVAYLSTTAATMPPDRSWLYGLTVHWLLHATQGYLSYLAIQACLLLLVTMLCTIFLAGGARSLAFAVFAAAICLDPLLSIYERFYLTDFLACLLFVGFLAALCCGLRANRAGFLLWLLIMAMYVILDIFVRVAYGPVIILTVLIIALEAFRYRQPVAGRLALVLCLPFIAVGMLMAANSFVFAKRFPGEIFVNKLSGVMLLGTWAPAVNADDFRAAGIHVSDADVAALGLPYYDKRGNQVWGIDEHAARILIMHRLGTNDLMSASVDRACSRIVWHALLRNPQGMVRVYAVTFLMQLDPRLWHGADFDIDTGITRALPAGFVGWMNTMTATQITASITQKPSPVLTIYRAVARGYPVLLGLGLVLAVWRLLGRRRRIGGILAAAGFIAVLATLPLYTTAVIPRYAIAGVFLQYLLWADFWTDGRSSKPQSPRAPIIAEPAPQALNGSLRTRLTI